MYSYAQICDNQLIKIFTLSRNFIFACIKIHVQKYISLCMKLHILPYFEQSPAELIIAMPLRASHQVLHYFVAESLYQITTKTHTNTFPPMELWYPCPSRL